MSTDLSRIAVTALKGVGPTLAEKLARLGIESAQDVLFHLPFRYEDRTRVSAIGSVQPGQTYVLEGEITACDLAYGRRRSLLAWLQDDTGKIALRFFHFSKAQQQHLGKAGKIRCFGEVRRGAAGYEIYHPEYAKLSDAIEPEEALTPVYPATEGINQARYRKLAEQSMALLEDHGIAEIDVGDSRYVKMGLTDAIRYIHRPPPNADIARLQAGSDPSQQRLAFEELLAHQTSLRTVRKELKKLPAPQLAPPGASYHALGELLGFELTRAQQRVSEEVAQDMMTPSPTLRLVQGDVGSGKTIIAAQAAIHAQENNLQTALMAPTELLAEQHYINLSAWFTPLGIKTAWLSSRVTGKRRDETLASISMGDASVVIGTHALFQRDVEFSNLGLIIVDEQHRFGVHQRLALMEKGGGKKKADGDKTALSGRKETALSDEAAPSPHQLVMTATPIPRTLSMSMYADLDVSVIDELPPGRSPVNTTVISDEKRSDIVKRVGEVCAAGTQAYWVCTLIEESEALQCQAAEVTAEELTSLLPDVKVALIHGRMKAKEKTSAMNSFKQGDIDLLVATTVIEVGVDVPNASLMVIENSERLGLAQLHQLRGRVGRGSKQSHCVLLYKKPLGAISRERLEVMRESNDGFHIAERDLEIRGPGEILGSRQSGDVQFRIADLMRDKEMLTEVSKASMNLLRNSPESAEILVNRWIKDPEKLSQV